MTSTRWGRRSRLATASAAIVASLVVTIVVITSVDLHQQRQLAQRQLEDKGRLLAATLSETFANALYFSDIERVRYLAEILETQPEITHFAVFNPDGRILVSPDLDRYPEGQIEDETTEVLRGQETLLSGGNGATLDIVAPIRVGGQVLGGLRLELDPRAVTSSLRKQMVRQLLQESLVLLLGLGLAYVVSRSLRTAEHLRKTEELLRLLAENMREALWMIDLRSRRILYLSPAYETIWGRKPEEVLGSPDERYAAVHPDDRERITAGAFEERDTEYRLLRSDGAIRWIRERTVIVRDATGSARWLVGAADDVTEHKRLEMDLLHAQKMDSLGRLAGGVAHDFNNLLTGILGFATLGEERHPPAKVAGRYFQQIRQAAESGASLTHQLLSFSRHQVTEAKLVHLGALIRERSALLKRVVGEDVELETRIGKRLGSVRIDPGQFEQVLMNLVVNAREAMPEGGHLRIEAGAVAAEGGSFVRVRIRDTGVGIPVEIRERIFEPFFSTKTEKKGTSLGLATCYGIVRQHGGRIELDSEEGRGSTFDVLLPRVEAASEESPRDPGVSSGEVGGHETILIAEDDPTVRALTFETLTTLGYRVLEAEDGVKALEVAEAAEGPIDLLLTDIVMPRMGGRELANRLHEQRPELRVLYMSGYAADEIRSRELIEGGLEFLSKPFPPLELAARVRKVLGDPWKGPKAVSDRA